MMPPAIQNTLVDGLTRTYAMRLQGYPPADALDGMMQAWIAAFNGLPWAWDEARDVPRMEQAFACLWASVDRWPQPKTLIDCMPTIIPPLALAAPRKVWTAEEVIHNKQRIKEILSQLNSKIMQPTGEQHHESN